MKTDDNAGRSTKILYRKERVLWITEIVRSSLLFADSGDGILLRGIDCDDPDLWDVTSDVTLFKFWVFSIYDFNGMIKLS